MAAAPAPSKVDFDLGGNMHGQPVTATRADGRWIVSRAAANQMDDSARIELSDEQMRMLGGLADWSK